MPNDEYYMHNNTCTHTMWIEWREGDRETKRNERAVNSKKKKENSNQTATCGLTGTPILFEQKNPTFHGKLPLSERN